MIGVGGRVVGGGALWMIDRGGFGHSQEVVRSASGHMGLATAGGGVKLKAEKAKKVCYQHHLVMYFRTNIHLQNICSRCWRQTLNGDSANKLARTIQSCNIVSATDLAT